MAEQLIDSLTTDFDPSAYRDEYREELLALIERKAEGKEIVALRAEEPEADQGARPDGGARGEPRRGQGRRRDGKARSRPKKPRRKAKQSRAEQKPPPSNARKAKASK